MKTTHEQDWALLVPDAGSWRCVAIGERLVLGRDRTCDVVLSGADIDARHCRLQVSGGRLSCVDLGSRAGTTLRGQALTARAMPLTCGDVLRLGRVPVIAVRSEERHGAAWLQMGDLGSSHPQMRQVLAGLALAAGADWPLWLAGESGCGKELAARLVHTRSARASQAWVAVNCAALHGDTLLAELFGAARGAYTGCTEARRGAFERADGGTLFLDEVAELTPAAQAALLRVLESGEVQVLGGAVRQVDVRVLCASHRDLRQEVAAGRFRLDLLHRLSVMEVRLPPLRERGDDARILLQEFLGDLRLPPGAGAVLARHSWGGNVRELRNIARRLQSCAMWGDPTLPELQAAIGSGTALASGVADCVAPRPAPAGLPSARSQDRRQVVASLLGSASSTSEALRQSGLPRGTFFRYLKEVRAQPMQAF